MPIPKWETDKSVDLSRFLCASVALLLCGEHFLCALCGSKVTSPLRAERESLKIDAVTFAHT
jgi:hypothetical protein